MSWINALEPACPDSGQVCSVEILIAPTVQDPASFDIRCGLPVSTEQLIPPFIGDWQQGRFQRPPHDKETFSSLPADQ